jgi:hypothetical protein
LGHKYENQKERHHPREKYAVYWYKGNKIH